MGRLSVLTDSQREEIGRRLASGETLRGLSRSLGIAYTTLRRNFSDQAPAIKNVAETLARAELDLASLPRPAQRAARTLADQLKSIQDSYATAAINGAQTAAHLSGLAQRRASTLDIDAEAEDLRTIAALQETANKALQPAASLIAGGTKRVDLAADRDATETDGRLEIVLIRPALSNGS